MEETKFIWMDGQYVSWPEAKVHVLTHTLHYGAGAFEGIRCYSTSRGPAVFRLREHVDRLLFSCSVLQMNLPYSADELATAIVDLVKQNELKEGYIRPLAYYGYGKMGLSTKGAPIRVCLACWPWGKYLAGDSVAIKVSKYIRIHPASTVSEAKLVGHYVNSILGSHEVEDTEYHEALFLDFEGNVAEGPGENIFLVKDGEICTPKRGNILAGITRSTVMQIAKDLGLPVREKVVSLDELLKADELFFTGTAAEVTPISRVDTNVIGSGEVGKVTRDIQNIYKETVQGKREEYLHFLTFLNS